jgi:hypothetical protein
MTVGKLYHDDVVVYGGALIEAAELEKSVVSTPRIAITERCMELIDTDFSRKGASNLMEDFIRDYGSGPFVHVLGHEWPFLEKERKQEQAGELHGDGVAEMFREVRSALPLRYSVAPHEGAKRKLEWMRDYVNRSVDEHGLSRVAYFSCQYCLPERCTARWIDLSGRLHESFDIPVNWKPVGPTEIDVSVPHRADMFERIHGTSRRRSCGLTIYRPL